MKFDKLYLPLSMAKDFRFQLSKPVNKKIGDLSYEHGKRRISIKQRKNDQRLR